MRRHGILLCRLAGAVVAAAMALGPVGSHAMTWATEGDYPPWNQSGADGHLSGFDIDLVHALCQRLRADCTIVTAAFPGMMDRLAAGDFDAIVSGIAITAERQQLIAFTRPYMSLSLSFAVPRRSPLAGKAAGSPAETLSLLDRVRVGAQRATVNAEFVRTALPHAVLVTFENQEALGAAVAGGSVDAGLAATEAWKRGVRASADEATITIGPPFTSTDYPILGAGLGIGIAKGKSALKDSLDAAICTLAADATIAALSVKWFGQDLSVPCP